MITIYEWQLPFGLASLGFDLKDRAGKNQIASLVRQTLATTPAPRSLQNPPTLQLYVDKYSEQVTTDAAADIQKYIQFQRGLGFTVGGVPTGFAPLAMGRQAIRPSNTAIAGLAEGLAGWYLENSGFLPLARPVGEGPDIVFFAPQQMPPYVLVQVKGTQQSDVRGQMRSAAVPLLEYGFKVGATLPSNTFSCHVVGVVISSATNFDVLSLRADLLRTGV